MKVKSWLLSKPGVIPLLQRTAAWAGTTCSNSWKIKKRKYWEWKALFAAFLGSTWMFSNVTWQLQQDRKQHKVSPNEQIYTKTEIKLGSAAKPKQYLVLTEFWQLNDVEKKTHNQHMVSPPHLPVPQMHQPCIKTQPRNFHHSEWTANFQHYHGT